MKSTHLTTKRELRKMPGFCWARVPTLPNAFVPGAEWRLFRRDYKGRTHTSMRLFPVEVPRAEIARELRAMRRQLRDCVDEIDLQQWGTAA